MSLTTYAAPDQQLGHNATERDLGGNDTTSGAVRLGPAEMTYCGWTIRITTRHLVPAFRATIHGPDGEEDSMRASTERAVHDLAKDEIDRRIEAAMDAERFDGMA